MITRRMATLLIAASAASAATPTTTGKTRGVPMAKVTLEVFSDFQCPACKALHEQTLKQFVTDYVDTGKVYLVHRDFPLPMHAYARQAAGLACAAARLGKYDPTADALFAAQDAWSKDGKVEDALVKAVGAAEAKRISDLAKSPDIAAEIERDIQKGREAKLQQTPTMVVMHNSKTYPVAGVVTYPILRRFIDQLLAQ
jgi:protein-disulfide isomerase